MSEGSIADQAAATTPDVERSSRGRRWGWRVAVLTAAWLCLAIAALALVVRHVDSGNRVLVLTASFAWVLGLLVLPGAVLLVLGRQWWGLVAVVAVIAVQVHDYGPWFRPSSAPTGTAITVMTQNLRLGLADAGSVVGHVRDERVDVLVVQELTAEEVGRLRSAGLDGLLPYSSTSPGEGIRGNGVWSRYPLVADDAAGADLAPGLGLAEIRVPGEPTPLTVFGLHASSPWRDVGQRTQTLDQAFLLMRASGGTGPAIALGDFNATIDHARFRTLLADGWSDGAAQAGAGIVRTWPSDRPVPPLLGLDHVLTRGVVTTSMHTVETPGTDHRGLVARIAFPAP